MKQERVRLPFEVQRFLGEYLSKQYALKFESPEGQQVYAPAKMRGNKSYNFYLYNRFAQIERNIRSLVRIDDTHSNAVMFTITYPRSTTKDSWMRFKTESKLFLDRLRKNKYIKKFGKFEYLNVIESTANGELHCHSLLIFEKQFRYVKAQRQKYNVDFGMICDAILRDEIKGAWPHISDACAAYSIGGAVSYIQKYFFKQFSNLELVLERCADGWATHEELKVLYCFYGVLKNRLRMFRASRSVSRAAVSEASADGSLVELLNNCESPEPKKWVFVAVCDYWRLRDALMYHFGADFDFHRMNSVTFTQSGELVKVERNKYYDSLHAEGVLNAPACMRYKTQEEV